MTSYTPMNPNSRLLLPTPTKSMGKRGWGISLTGRRRYSEKVQKNALKYGYKPPMAMIEWMMGFPPGFMRPLLELTETP